MTTANEAATTKQMSDAEALADLDRLLADLGIRVDDSEPGMSSNEFFGQSDTELEEVPKENLEEDVPLEAKRYAFIASAVLAGLAVGMFALDVLPDSDSVPSFATTTAPVSSSTT